MRGWLFMALAESKIAPVTAIRIGTEYADGGCII